MHSLRLFLILAAIPAFAFAAEPETPAPAPAPPAKAEASNSTDAKEAIPHPGATVEEAEGDSALRSILPRPSLVPTPPKPSASEPRLRSIPSGSPVSHLRQAAEHLRLAGMIELADRVDNIASERRGSLISTLNEKRETVRQLECDIADLEREIGSLPHHAISLVLLRLHETEQPSLNEWQKFFDHSNGSELPTHQALVPQQEFHTVLRRLLSTRAAKVVANSPLILSASQPVTVDVVCGDGANSAESVLTLNTSLVPVASEVAKIQIEATSSSHGVKVSSEGQFVLTGSIKFQEDLTCNVPVGKTWVAPVKTPNEGKWFLAITLKGTAEPRRSAATDRLEPIPDGRIAAESIHNHNESGKPGFRVLPEAGFSTTAMISPVPPAPSPVHFSPAAIAPGVDPLQFVHLRQHLPPAGVQAPHVQRMSQIHAGPGMAIIEMGIPFEQPRHPFYNPAPIITHHGVWTPAVPHNHESQDSQLQQGPGIHFLPATPHEAPQKPAPSRPRIGQSVAFTGHTVLADRKEPHAFVPLGSVTVNLNEERMQRYLRTEIILQVEPEHAEQIQADAETHHAEIRSWLIKHLSDKSISDIRGSQGQDALAKEIQAGLTKVLGPDSGNRITAVLFTEFNVQ